MSDSPAGCSPQCHVCSLLLHVLYHLLPKRRELIYNIRPRHHDRQLSIITGQLRKWNFIYLCCSKTLINCFITVLLTCFYSYFYLYFNLVQMCYVILCNKRICMYVCMSVCMNKSDCMGDISEILPSNRVFCRVELLNDVTT